MTTMTTIPTGATADPPSAERLAEIRANLARLANPDNAYAAPYTWAAMLRDTLAALDHALAQLGAQETHSGRAQFWAEAIGWMHRTGQPQAAQTMEDLAVIERLPKVDPFWCPTIHGAKTCLCGTHTPEQAVESAEERIHVEVLSRAAPSFCPVVHGARPCLCGEHNGSGPRGTTH